MNKALLIWRRELLAYVRSPLGAVVMACALLIAGIIFYREALSQKLLSGEALVRFFYNTSGVTMLAALILSIRLIAEERQTSTFTVLNTAPVRDWQIVVGKFASIMTVMTLLIALTGYMPALLFVNGKVSLGHIAVGYLGLWLLAAGTAAIGLFASSLTRSQVIAAIVGAVTLGLMLVVWMLSQVTAPPVNTFLGATAFHHNNFRPFQQGRLELQSVAYYLAVTYFFLLCATKILEARRWR